MAQTIQRILPFSGCESNWNSVVPGCWSSFLSPLHSHWHWHSLVALRHGLWKRMVGYHFSGWYTLDYLSNFLSSHLRKIMLYFLTLPLPPFFLSCNLAGLNFARRAWNSWSAPYLPSTRILEKKCSSLRKILTRTTLPREWGKESTFNVLGASQTGSWLAATATSKAT